MTVGILIPIPRAFVLTATANSLVGAELYVYENLTTTPVTLYSDRACTTPAANPIVSSAGFFPRRYMASAQLLTLTLKNTAGSTVHSDDYVAGSAESGNEVYDIALTTAGGTTAYTLTTGLSLGAYASGVAFLIKMNATNTGASTLNVDGLGAKDLTKNGSTALSSGDLVSGRIYRVAYDGTRFQVVGVVPDATDATIAALAALTISDNVIVRGTGTDTFEAIVATPVAQQVHTQTGAVATGTTTLPYDDTIPQSTEGDQYMSLAITPKNASNILVVDVVVNLASSAAGARMSAALFQDSTADALAANGGYTLVNANDTCSVAFRHRMTAGTTSATTFKVRAGASAAGTTTFNGFGGARKFGGVLTSSITITELWA